MSLQGELKGSTTMSRRDLIALARVDFGVFLVLMFPELHNGRQMAPAAYVNLMVEALMSVRDGAENRLIFNLPPGHMKSMIVSVMYTAWMLGCHSAPGFDPAVVNILKWL